jgi:deaminated glutathione amidase
MVINPWGQIQSYLESGEGIVVGELNHSEIKDTRQKLPALKHRTHF